MYIKRLSKFIFYFLLVFSFCSGQIIRFKQGSVGFNLIDIFSILTLFVLTIYVVLNRKFIIFSHYRYFFYFICICIFSLVLKINYLDPGQFFIAFLYILRLVSLASIPIFIRYVLREKKENILLLLVVCGALISTIGIIQFVFYPNLANLTYLEWDNHLYRLFSVFLDPNFTGVILGLSFILNLSFVFQKKRLKSKLIFLILAIICSISVFLTFSRTSMISMLIGVFVLMLSLRKIKELVFIVMLFAVSVYLLSDVGVEGLNPFRKVSTSARIDSANTAYNIWLKNPAVGVGYNAYRYAQNRYGFRTSEKWQVSNADAGVDNSLLLILATTGIFGFIIYLNFWKNIFEKVIGNLYLRKNSHTNSVVLSSSISVIFSSLFTNTLFYPFIFLWTMLLISIILDD